MKDSMKELRFNILTLFPSFFDNFFATSLVGRAVKQKIVTYRIIDIRNFGIGRHKKVDDYTFSGEVGMLLRHDVLTNAYHSLIRTEALERMYTIYLAPQGKPLDQGLAYDLASIAEKKSLTLVCGHYEGVDQRFIDNCVDKEVSIGDYVLSGGESAALVLMDAIIRLKKHVIGNPASLRGESFEKNLLKHHQYTRPFDKNIPSILTSGHHKAIFDWKQANKIAITYEKRPDLFKEYPISPLEFNALKEHVYQKFSYQQNKKRSHPKYPHS